MDSSSLSEGHAQKEAQGIQDDVPQNVIKLLLLVTKSDKGGQFPPASLPDCDYGLLWKGLGNTLDDSIVQHRWSLLEGMNSMNWLALGAVRLALIEEEVRTNVAGQYYSHSASE